MAAEVTSHTTAEADTTLLLTAATLTDHPRPTTLIPMRLRTGLAPLRWPVHRSRLP